MKKRIIIKAFVSISLILILLSISQVSLTNSGGAPARYSNAPGENNCTSCHTGTLQTSGANYNNISFTNDFTGGGYIPDSTYTFTLKYTHTGKSKFGYQLTCLDSQDKMAGSFSTISGNNKSSIISGIVSGATRNYIRQTSSGNSGTGSITWDFKWTAPKSNLGDLTIYSVVNSANGGSSGAAGDIIIAREFTISPSSDLPEATAAADDSTVCASQSVSLKGSSTKSATKWNWELPNGSPNSSTSQNPSVVYNFPGKYNAILTTTNAKGKSLPDTVVITINETPSAFISGGKERTICVGDSVELGTNFQPGVNYLWSNGEKTNSIWVKDSGTYSVVATSSNNCSRRSNEVKAKLYASPVLSLSSNAGIFNDSSCTNTTIELQASPSLFDSFYFFANNTSVGVTADSFLGTNFDSTTTFAVSVLDSKGCISPKEEYNVVAKNRLDAPNIACSIITPTSIEFDWSSTFFHDGFEVSLNKGLSWQSPSSGTTGTTHKVSGLNPQDTVELWIRGKDVAPCFYSKIGTATCSSDTCTPLNPTITYEKQICYGDLLTIEVNGLSNEYYGLSFDNSEPFTDTIIQFNPLLTGTYQLSVIDSNFIACPANEFEIGITVDRIFDIDLKPKKLGAYCEGEAVTFTANDTIEQFDFYYNGAVVQSGTSNTYTNPSMKNNDSVAVVVQKGVCRDTSDTEYVTFEAPADASFSFTRQGSVYTFTPDDQNFALYNWDFGDGSANSNDLKPTHDYKDDEGNTVTVKLDITTVNNCLAESSENINLPVFSSVRDIASFGVKAYPNPVKNYLIIENESGKSISGSLTTLEGKVVKQFKVRGKSLKLDVSELSRGSYNLVINKDLENASFRFVKN